MTLLLEGIIESRITVTGYEFRGYEMLETINARDGLEFKSSPYI